MSSNFSLQDAAERLVMELEALTEASQAAKVSLFADTDLENHFLRAESIAKKAKNAFTLLTTHASFPSGLSTSMKEKIQNSVRKWHVTLADLEYCAKEQIARAKDAFYNGESGTNETGESTGTFLNESL